ncbi:hypothetical protein BUALT_Bualt04G0078800 [Buddleja alternifolia]|uniref:Retrotransposon gag domain-containing protein n=1 Tax=Buddleja alternifolia TaxID=168488 RepID=A0AAV6XTW0_9LAMI|nr:hypothetical protein BUALT_Bualt04G0078800 [Buddleja alternifolia]
MADGTRIVELRKDVDGLKMSSERTEKTLEELRTMIINLTANAQITHLISMLGEIWGKLGANLRIFVGKMGGIIITRFLPNVHETPSDAKVKLATVHLEGKALQWHQIFMKGRLTRELPNWEEYVRALSDRFGVLLYDDPMAELVNLKQAGTIQKYLDKFDELMNCVELSQN